MSTLKTLTVNGKMYEVVPVVPAASVTLRANGWSGSEGNYYQVVTLGGVTSHTKVDLQPTPDQLVEFHNKVLSFVSENNGGVVTVYAIGDKPKRDHTIQVTLTEVAGTGKIRGNTVGTTMPRANLNQTDSTKADYVLGKDEFLGEALAKAMETGDFKGADGISPTVSVSKSGKVTTVSIVDKNGTKTATINDGTDGASVTVKSVTESTVDGGSNVITFSDGKSVTIKNGKTGSKGATGEAGTSVTVKSVSESPTDGDSNVVTFSDGKTLTIKNGKTGGKGDTGKTAYQYAVDGGYTGTETEFAKKLAAENAKDFLFSITYEGDENGAGHIDVAFSEILDAYENGSTILCDLSDTKVSDFLVAPMAYDGYSFYTSGTGENSHGYYVTIDPNSVYVERHTPTSSGGVTSWKDLPDKPEGVGYTESVPVMTLIENTTVVQKTNNNVSWITYNILAGAEKVRVDFDGVTYICPVTYTSDPGDGDGYHIGNFAGTAPEYPFSFWGYSNLAWSLLGLSDDSEHTMSVYLTEETVHKIDPKFLPDGAIKHKRYSFEFTASELTRDGTFFGVTEARAVELDNMIAEISSLTVVSIGLTGSLPGLGKFIHVPCFCNPRNAAFSLNGSIGGRAMNSNETIMLTPNGFTLGYEALLSAVQGRGAILTIDVLYS